ncbi:MAG: DsrE/DsrF/DrsH-like family protein [Nitrospiraceae bacterium]|nr:DsrE/DsrF/DrsH-like family protein [Nitrospiraceae bacterium]
MAYDTGQELDPKLREYLNRYIDSRIIGASKQLYDGLNKKIKAVEDKIHQVEAKTVKNRVAIVASKGTLDMAYPPLLLATTARSMGLEASIFFTLYGMKILKKNAKLKVAPLANPAMPMPVPNIIGALPGMTAMASVMMKGMFKKQAVPPIKELLDMSRESGVKMIACQMTMDVLGIKQKDLIDGIEYGGLATFIEYGMGSTITLFV